MREMFPFGVEPLRSSVTGGLAQLPGVRHGADAAVHLLHGVHHVVEFLGAPLFVSQILQSRDHILKDQSEETRLSRRVACYFSRQVCLASYLIKSRFKFHHALRVDEHHGSGDRLFEALSKPEVVHERLTEKNGSV